MLNYIILIIILISTSYLYLKLAIKYKIIDKPNERSSHKKITVRGGGIIFTVAIILFYLLNDFQYSYFVLGVLIISIISFLDDILTLSSKIRFPFQFLSVFLILYQIDFPFHPLYIYTIAFVFGIGMINMFNFMDGINGITGLYSLATLSGLYLINYHENIINSDLIIYTVISLIIFGFYNFRKKALFFAGDIGSITIGMLIFFIVLYFTYLLEAPLILLTIIVYGGDAGYTLIYRKLFTKESIFEPHRHHIYQKLVHVKKISHLKVSIGYAFLQLLINIVIFKSYKLDLITQLIIFSFLIISFTCFYIFAFKKLKT